MFSKEKEVYNSEFKKNKQEFEQALPRLNILLNSYIEKRPKRFGFNYYVNSGRSAIQAQIVSAMSKLWKYCHEHPDEDINSIVDNNLYLFQNLKRKKAIKLLKKMVDHLKQRFPDKEIAGPTEIHCFVGISHLGALGLFLTDFNFLDRVLNGIKDGFEISYSEEKPYPASDETGDMHKPETTDSPTSFYGAQSIGVSDARSAL